MKQRFGNASEDAQIRLAQIKTGSKSRTARKERASGWQNMNQEEARTVQSRGASLQDKVGVAQGIGAAKHAAERPSRAAEVRN